MALTDRLGRCQYSRRGWARFPGGIRKMKRGMRHGGSDLKKRSEGFAAAGGGHHRPVSAFPLAGTLEPLQAGRSDLTRRVKVMALDQTAEIQMETAKTKETIPFWLAVSITVMFIPPRGLPPAPVQPPPLGAFHRVAGVLRARGNPRTHQAHHPRLYRWGILGGV